MGLMMRPVIIARMRLLNPARTTMATWTMRKSRRDPETSPDHQGKQEEDHDQIGTALNYVVRVGFRLLRRRAAKILRDHFPERPPRPIGRRREEVFPEVAG